LRHYLINRQKAIDAKTGKTETIIKENSAKAKGKKVTPRDGRTANDGSPTRKTSCVSPFSSPGSKSPMRKQKTFVMTDVSDFNSFINQALSGGNSPHRRQSEIISTKRKNFALNDMTSVIQQPVCEMQEILATDEETNDQ
jgi:hypothetical protein